MAWLEQSWNSILLSALQLANSSADVVCLQEIWQQQDILDVAYSALGQFPYYHSYNSTGSPGDTISPSSACDPTKFQGLQLCLFTSCSSVVTQGLAAATACAFTHCQSHVDQLGQQCINCLVFIDATGTSMYKVLLHLIC